MLTGQTANAECLKAIYLFVTMSRLSDPGIQYCHKAILTPVTCITRPYKLSHMLHNHINNVSRLSPCMKHMIEYNKQQGKGQNQKSISC